MVSVEVLRRYPFFSNLKDTHLSAIAMITEEVSVKEGTVFFEEGEPANTLYLLIEGYIDLYYKSEEKFYPKTRKQFTVGEINPGEVFAISTLIEPYKYSATARASKKCRVLKIEGEPLRELLHMDFSAGYAMMCQIAKLALERLAYTRVQLAAAWAE